jgi:hypothetical protein
LFVFLLPTPFRLGAVLLLVSGCHPALTTAVYHPTSYSPRVTLALPTGYALQRVAAEGDVEYRYQYPDSSVVYISTFPTPHSYHPINHQHAFYTKQAAIDAKTALVLAGTDQLGLQWQDRSLLGVSIGFYGVPANRLAAMQQAMTTLHVKPPRARFHWFAKRPLMR